MAVLFLGACGKKITIKKDCPCGYYTTSSGTLLHWNDGSKLTFVYHSDFPENLRPAASAGAHHYNQLFEKTRVVLDPGVSSAPSLSDHRPESVGGDGINGVYWLQEPWPWDKQDPNSVAMTVLQFSTTGITEADVFFRANGYDGPVYMPNSDLFSSLIQNTGSLLAEAGAQALLTEPADILKESSMNVRWIYVIAVHEFGHAMGRVHAGDEHKDSIMYQRIGLDSLKKPFTSYDVDVFSKAYQVNSHIPDLVKN